MIFDLGSPSIGIEGFFAFVDYVFVAQPSLPSTTSQVMEEIELCASQMNQIILGGNIATQLGCPGPPPFPGS